MATNKPREEEDPGEAALDDTIAATFPASDPLSTDPNPGHPGEQVKNSEKDRHEPRVPEVTR
jgi:hypothetical protein